MTTKKNNVIDLWDIVLLVIVAGSSYLVYMTPVWTNPSQLLQFLMIVGDKILGWTIFAVILKKVLEKSNNK